MKKITAYTWAFILLIITFFTVGMFTLGSVKTTGDAMTLVKEQSVYYELPNAETSSQTIKAVYVNVGAIHDAVGADAVLTVKTTSSTKGIDEASWSQLGEAVTIGNVHSAEGKDGALYNWVALATGQSRSARKFSLTSTITMNINEVVAINKNNEIIPLKAYVIGTEYSSASVSATLDKQDDFMRFMDEKGAVTLPNSVEECFTQEEGYYMSSVQNVLSGSDKFDAYYTLDENFNYFATVLMTPAVALFGTSTFALRLPAFVATCLMIVFAYLLIKELTKREQLAFYFSIVLMIGGFATTVGRLGAPYMMVASAIVASAYYMYRFFSRGISSKDMLRGAFSILFSGLFAAVALAMDATAILPVAGILVLFAFGLRRQKLAHEIALSKVVDKGETVQKENGESIVVNKAADKEMEDYATKTRLSYGFAAMSFLMATVLFILFSGIICYSAYVRANNNQAVNFLTILGQGIKNSFRDNKVTAYAASNASVLSWIVPFKPATLFAGVTSSAEGTSVLWSVMPNLAAYMVAALAFVVTTVKVIVDLLKDKTDKQSLRMRRGYYVLLGGMVLALGAGLIRGNVSALSGVLFHVLYLAFLPLLGMLIPEGETTQEKALVNVALGVAVLVFAVIFVMTLPAVYGYTVATSRAKWFTWIGRIAKYIKF